LAKRKQDELSALQKKTKMEKQKQINAQKQRKNKGNVDIARIQQWIISNTEKMLRFKELRLLLSQEEEVFKSVEEEISEEQGSLASLSVRQEKLEKQRA